MSAEYSAKERKDVTSGQWFLKAWVLLNLNPSLNAFSCQTAILLNRELESLVAPRVVLLLIIMH
jgi:hypothetical protein